MKTSVCTRNGFLIALLNILVYGTLVYLMTQHSAPRLTGTVISSSQEIETRTIHRGDLIQTDTTFARITIGNHVVHLAERTELRVDGFDSQRLSVTLLGGRIMTETPIVVSTPWIRIISDDGVSVVHYSWKQEVQLLPFGATTLVDNTTLGMIPVSLPTQWIEQERALTTALEPFRPERSSEAPFYAWSRTQTHLQPSE